MWFWKPNKNFIPAEDANIFLFSDTHFGHDRQFIWGPRHYESVAAHDEALIANWNSVVGPNDIVYLLGDVMLGDNNHGLECLRYLNGHIIIIRGNHDSNARVALYEKEPNVLRVVPAEYLKVGKYHFYLSHFPTLTGNLEAESLKQCTLNLYGHTHQSTQFYEDRPYMYCVGPEANNNTPVEIHTIIERMKDKVKECLTML